MTVEQYVQFMHYAATNTGVGITYVAICALVFAIGWRLLCLGISMRQHGNIWDKPE